MKSSEVMQNILDHCRMNGKDFAQEIGLENAQTVYNILKDRYGISTGLANMIIEKFPEISYDYLRGKSDNMIGGAQAINIQSNNSDIKKMKSVTHNSDAVKDAEIKRLKDLNKQMAAELERYREREKTLMKLLESAGSK